MAKEIPFQDGIAAFVGRMNAAATDADPEVAGVAWPDKLGETLTQLKQGHNEIWREDTGLADRLLAVEEALKGIPFVPSSMG
jgi:hypothetical protein